MGDTDKVSDRVEEGKPRLSYVKQDYKGRKLRVTEN